MSLSQLSSFVSMGLMLSFITGIPLFAAIRGINVFESFTTGAKEGLGIVIKIIPYLVGFLVAVGMFRAAGGFTLLVQPLTPLLHYLGFPPELLPLALIRPFSTVASNSLLVDIAHTYGGDSFLAHTAGVIMGSTETTFYVVMVYFGAVGISRTRYAIPAGLIADAVGAVAAVVVMRWFMS